MNIAIKMLSLSTFIIWIIILFFLVTAVFSVTRLNVGVGEPDIFPTSNGVTFSLPFYVNNEGYYEIADVNLTTRITDPQGQVLDVTETIVESIPPDSNVTATHTIPLDIDEILALDYMPLLFDDSEFGIELVASANFAKAVPVQFSMNTSIPWGAPLANFDIGDVVFSPFNSTHHEGLLHIHFENHAVMDIQGLMRVELYTESGRFVAWSDEVVDVGSMQSYDRTVSLYPTNLDVLEVRENNRIHVSFMSSLFTAEWWE